MGVITLALIASGHWTDSERRSRSGSSSPARSRSRWAPTSAAGGSSAPSARAWSRSAHRRAWPPRARRPPSSSPPATSASRCRRPRSPPGSILGSGLGRPGAQVRWASRRPDGGRLVHHHADGRRSPARSMWWISDLIGGIGGALVIVAILIALSFYMWLALAPRAHHLGERQRRVGRDAGVAHAGLGLRRQHHVEPFLRSRLQGGRVGPDPRAPDCPRSSPWGSARRSSRATRGAPRR